ncbi:MAG: potassium channel family protein [Candidatus Micrarchaeia archaeon]
MRLRIVHALSVLMLFIVFAISAALAYVAVRSVPIALIFGLVNIIGATFPPSPSMIDAQNPFLLSSLVLGIIGSIVLTILFTSFFYQFLSGKSISEWLAKQKINRMKSHTIITPINGIALELAAKLSSNGIESVLIDVSKQKVRQAIRSGHIAIAGDASELATLNAAKIESATVLFSLYEEDIKNVFITIAAKSANERCSVISRAKRIDDIPKLERAGARRIILPEAAVGEEMAAYIASKY